MISADLLARVACPVCLEAAGCALCSDGAGHASCTERYAARAGCPCGGPDKVRLTVTGDALTCRCCQGRYEIHAAEGYVDLVPGQSLGEGTHYADHEFHERLGVTEAPPLLSAGIKFETMRRMLELRRGDAVLDLGSGAGKFALACAKSGLRATGVDVAPFFLPGATKEVDLVVGDLRRLPFRKDSYPAAYSLDVLEHLDESGVNEVLTEARRVIGDSGRLLVYTHAMESSRLAVFQRGVNRLAKRLGEKGWIDHEREAMRKSDHRNPLRSHEHFDALCARSGLAVVSRRYYNVVAKAVVEDLGLRLFEQYRKKRRPQTPPGQGQREPSASTSGPGDAVPAAPASTPALGGAMPSARLLAIARALTWVLRLDMALFGRVRTGPFFGLIRPQARAIPPVPAVRAVNEPV
jgi:SAM-dependent methyltransferase